MKPYLGEWAEKLAGRILGLLGIWILIDAILNAGSFLTHLVVF